MSGEHEHRAGEYPHPDGTLRVWCIDCEEILGEVTTSGIVRNVCADLDACDPNDIILPRRPAFWDEPAEKVWMREWIAAREASGQYVDPKAYETAA